MESEHVGVPSYIVNSELVEFYVSKLITVNGETSRRNNISQIIVDGANESIIIA